MKALLPKKPNVVLACFTLDKTNITVVLLLKQVRDILLVFSQEIVWTLAVLLEVEFPAKQKQSRH